VETSGQDPLWNNFKSGDRDSFAKIYSMYIEDLLSYGYRVTSNRQLIKDSIQDVFLSLWQQRHNISETSSIKFYLFRALRNRIVRNIEIHHEKPVFSENLFIESVLIDFPFEDVIMENETNQEQIKRLQNAIRQLPKRQQEVVQLRYNQNFSLEEIADLMQISNQSVRNLLHRSISELRRFFQATGWIFFFILLLK
jgi:RNA polymerase sigma factor (sigma-70 family)